MNIVDQTAERNSCELLFWLVSVIILAFLVHIRTVALAIVIQHSFMQAFMLFWAVFLFNAIFVFNIRGIIDEVSAIVWIICKLKLRNFFSELVIIRLIINSGIWMKCEELCKTYTTKKLELNNLRPCDLKYSSCALGTIRIIIAVCKYNNANNLSTLFALIEFAISNQFSMPSK